MNRCRNKLTCFPVMKQPTIVRPSSVIRPQKRAQSKRKNNQYLEDFCATGRKQQPISMKYGTEQKSVSTTQLKHQQLLSFHHRLLHLKHTLLQHLCTTIPNHQSTLNQIYQQQLTQLINVYTSMSQMITSSFNRMSGCLNQWLKSHTTSLETHNSGSTSLLQLLERYQEDVGKNWSRIISEMKLDRFRSIVSKYANVIEMGWKEVQMSKGQLICANGSESLIEKKYVPPTISVNTEHFLNGFEKNINQLSYKTDQNTQRSAVKGQQQSKSDHKAKQANKQQGTYPLSVSPYHRRQSSNLVHQNTQKQLAKSLNRVLSPPVQQASPQWRSSSSMTNSKKQPNHASKCWNNPLLSTNIPPSGDVNGHMLHDSFTFLASQCKGMSTKYEDIRCSDEKGGHQYEKLGVNRCLAGTNISNLSEHAKADEHPLCEQDIKNGSLFSCNEYYENDDAHQMGENNDCNLYQLELQHQHPNDEQCDLHGLDEAYEQNQTNHSKDQDRWDLRRSVQDIMSCLQSHKPSKGQNRLSGRGISDVGTGRPNSPIPQRQTDQRKLAEDQPTTKCLKTNASHASQRILSHTSHFSPSLQPKCAQSTVPLHSTLHDYVTSLPETQTAPRPMLSMSDVWLTKKHQQVQKFRKKTKVREERDSWIEEVRPLLFRPEALLQGVMEREAEYRNNKNEMGSKAQQLGRGNNVNQKSPKPRHSSTSKESREVRSQQPIQKANHKPKNKANRSKSITSYQNRRWEPFHGQAEVFDEKYARLGINQVGQIGGMRNEFGKLVKASGLR